MAPKAWVIPTVISVVGSSLAWSKKDSVERPTSALQDLPLKHFVQEFEQSLSDFLDKPLGGNLGL
jgi:hypothetical protein